MTDLQPIKPKNFWERPEGVTGGVFMGALLLGGGYLLYKILPTLILLAENTLYLAGILAALAAVIYVVLDPKMRNLVWYMYKAAMRWITGLFVQIDPIGILKSDVYKRQKLTKTKTAFEKTHQSLLLQIDKDVESMHKHL